MAEHKKLLVIEDEQSIRDVLRKALAKETRLEFMEASNGIEALNVIFDLKPDLVLLDVLMPKMHGLEVLDKIQADPRGKDIPIILLTNYAEDPKVVQAVKAGRCGLLSKTKIKISDVVDEVKKKLNLA